jgi:outer membrane receptor protein involved in Fe transport
VRGLNFKKNTIALAVGSAIGLGNCAWAAEESTVVEIAPITVTGEKINRTLEETQSSVVVVTEEKLREHADKNLVDLFARTPGVYSQADNETWGIRGVPVSGFDDQGPATINGPISVYVDGAVQPR